MVLFLSFILPIQLVVFIINFPIIGLICPEPLLEDRANFPNSIFTASNSVDNNTPEKARLSSGSSWCTSSNIENYLDIDFGVIYVVNSVTIFGDAVSVNWVTSYKLSYTRDGKNWIYGMSGTNKVFFITFYSFLILTYNVWKYTLG